MRVNAACRRDLQAAHQLDFTVGCQIEAGALGIQRVDDRGVRQRLQGVVQIDPRQRRSEAPILPAHALGVDHEQGRTVAGRQVLDRLVRKRILTGIELQRLAADVGFSL